MRDRDKEGSRRDRDRDIGKERDNSRGDRDLLRGDREIGRGDRDIGRGERDVSRGERDIGRVERDLGRGERDLGRERDMGRGERDLGRGERDIGRGERDLGRGERDLGRERELGRGERDLGRGERDLGRGERDMGRGERDIGRGERDLGRGERDLINVGERDLSRGELGRGEREIGRGERDIGRNDRELPRDEREIGMGRDRGRRAGSLDRDREERLRRDQPEFNGPNHMLDRGARFGFDAERDRPFEEPGRFRGGELNQRMGLFHGDMEMSRGFGRGFGGDPFDRRDMRGFEPRMERGRPMFQTFGRGRDRSWERGQERGGRDGRRFGDFRGDERAREFGSGARDGREERLLPFPPGASDKGLLPGGENRDGSRLDDNIRDEMRTRDADREDNWKRRGGSHDSKDQNRRKEEANVSDRVSHERGLLDPPVSKGKPNEKDNTINKDSKKEVLETVDKTKLSASAKIKASPVKEESPLTRDEPSLASLFSQTETVGPKKKAPAKSFGGKKSPKASDDIRKNTDKSKSTISSRMNTRRTTRSTDKKAPISKLDSSKEDVKGPNKESGKKDKDKRTPSPKNARSVSSQSAKTPKSPEVKTSNSPAPKRTGDSSRSARKVSPSPAVKDKEKIETKARSLSPSPALNEKKKEEVPKSTRPDTGKDQKKPGSRSGSLTGADSQQKTDTGSKSVEVEKSRRKSSDSESHVKDEEGDIAAAMLGDSIDEKQDEIVFSDWSEDDDADNILLGDDRRKNQVEDLDNDEYENSVRDMRARRSPAGGGRVYGRLTDFDKRELGDMLTERPALEKNIPNVKILEDVQKEKPAKERRKRNDDDEGYEAISSDENDLDEEGEKINKRTIVSIIDIDLEALMPQSKPRAASGPVFQRYKPASIFAELGLSKTYAGEALYSHVQEVCQQQLETMMEADVRREGKYLIFYFFNKNAF